MLVDGIEFTYEVKATDIETAHMVVEYTPVDASLMPMILNVPFVEYREWTIDQQSGQQVEVNTNKTFEEHKEYSIKCGAPVAVWRRQKLLIENL